MGDNENNNAESEIMDFWEEEYGENIMGAVDDEYDNQMRIKPKGEKEKKKFERECSGEIRTKKHLDKSSIMLGIAGLIVLIVVLIMAKIAISVIKSPDNSMHLQAIASVEYSELSSGDYLEAGEYEVGKDLEAGEYTVYCEEGSTLTEVQFKKGNRIVDVKNLGTTSDSLGIKFTAINQLVIKVNKSVYLIKN